MSESSRRLAAIMFTDIIGYTALMGQDEKKALKLLQTNRQILKPLIEKFNGQWIKEIGDGVLASFNTVSDAVYCAGAIQRASKAHPDLNLRIGIHQGEVVFQGNDVFGDGVNIASRLEPLAPTGGILVSESVHNNMLNKSGVASDFAGEVELKNVKHPVRTYLLTISNTNFDSVLHHSQSKKPTTPLKKKLLWGGTAVGVLFLITYLIYTGTNLNSYAKNAIINPPGKISIAVLPFQNNSGDPAMEPFCDGITNEVISRLSKIQSIEKVISRTSMMRYKNTPKSMPEVAKELDVTHILEGGFQKSGEQVKVNLQLIDGHSDNHFWSDDYLGQWGDIFTIQAEVAENVAHNLNRQIKESEMASIQERPTNNVEAYTYYLQADFQRNKQSEASYKIAIPLYEKAIEIDPEFVQAYSGLANVWLFGGLFWGIFNQQEAWNKAKSLLQKAHLIEPDNNEIQRILHYGYFYYDWDFKRVEQYYNTLISRDASSSLPGFTDYPIKTGRFEEALEATNQSIVDDPLIGTNYIDKAALLYLLDRKEEALNVLANTDPLYDDWWYVSEACKWYYILGKNEKFDIMLNKLMTKFSDRPPLVLWLNAVNHLRKNNHEEADRYVTMLHERYNKNTSGSPAWFLALYHVTEDEIDEAFAWLQRSYERHEVEMTWLREEPLLKPLRDDPRYKELYKKVGFADLHF